MKFQKCGSTIIINVETLGDRLFDHLRIKTMCQYYGDHLFGSLIIMIIRIKTMLFFVVGSNVRLMYTASTSKDFSCH